MSKARFEDQLDPADVALLKMAVVQIEAAPYSFCITTEFANDGYSYVCKASLCGSVLCIGGHMAILAYPEYLKEEFPDVVIKAWMWNLIEENGHWHDLFYLSLNWPQDSDERITPESLPERVEYWLRTGE